MYPDTSASLTLSHVADGPSWSHSQGIHARTASIPRVVQKTIFSIRNGVGCQRKGPKFGTVMSTNFKKRQRQTHTGRWQSALASAPPISC